MDADRSRRRGFAVSAMILTAVTFVIDCVTELGLAVPLLYIGVVWLAFSGPTIRFLWMTAGLACVLTIAGYFLSPPGNLNRSIPLSNRSIAIGAILVTAALCRRTRESLDELSNLKSDLECRVVDGTARLRASEERFELAVRGSTDGLWDWNVPSGEVYYSPRMKELVGYAEHELANTFETFETHLHPDDRDWVMREIDEHLRHHKQYDVQYRLRTKSGVYRWYRARGQAVWNAAGEALRMAGSITDVTEEFQLRERFRLAVEASPVALLMVHQDGEILMANARSLQLFGYAQAELIGQSIEVLVPERFRAGHPARRKQFFEHPVQRAMGAELELLGVRKDGHEFPVKVGLSPAETDDGPAVICGVTDITIQKQALEAMRLAKEGAESASRAKSSFLANMSHEIRTPMNGIIGMAQLLSQTELRSHQRDYLTTVEESAHILMRLLNDILDFSKIEAGKLELERVDFQLSECVGRASQMLVLRAAEKGLEIACRIAPDIPDHLQGDPGRLQQVLVNLLANAVKFTEAGEIFVNVNAESVSEDVARLHFSVSDTGIGISSDKQSQVFRPFEQAEASTTRRFGGTGLGLAISQQLVEMMRGRMWVESELGRGSTFHLTAEFDVSPDQHRHEPAEFESLQNLPVLVVDDNFTNRRVLSELLTYWQMQPVLADSAAAAREAFHKALQSSQPFRLILLDHHMPGEDGFHFAASLPEAPNGEGCKIIMISSGSVPVDADLCQKHGIARFMTKPVIASDLLSEILRQFGRYTTVKSDRTPLGDAGNVQIQKRRVLLVEDNEINRRVALGLLRVRGHQAEIAVNGQEAVEALRRQEFDVVLMDMQMPVMDGYEATTAIRDRERQSGGHTPIVAMTAEALKGDRERCLSAGMDDYVAKPISPADMYRAIEQYPAACRANSAAATAEGATVLPSSEAGAVQNDPGTVTATEAPCAAPPESAAATPSINWKTAAACLGGGASELLEFSQLVKTETATQLSEIQLAIESRDYKLLRRAAHTLKGSVNYFDAELVSQAALAVECLGRNESVEGSDKLLATLETELARFHAALDVGPPVESP